MSILNSISCYSLIFTQYFFKLILFSFTDAFEYFLFYLLLSYLGIFVNENNYILLVFLGFMDELPFSSILDILYFSLGGLYFALFLRLYFISDDG